MKRLHLAAVTLCAAVALVHDVAIAVGALSLANMEFDLTTVAALLTVVGFSVNDTVIISDRIRENLAKMRRERSDVAALPSDRTAADARETHDGEEQRAFADAIAAEDREAAVFGNLERDIVEHDGVAVAGAQVF